MSATEKSQKSKRVFFSDLYAEQHRIAGGVRADKRAKFLRDFLGVAQVFETSSGRVIELSERISEERIRIESKLNSDDLRSFDKRRHVLLFDLLKRIAIHVELRRAGVADEKSYAAIGRAVVELIGPSLNPASRDSVSNLKDDLNVALERFDRISKSQSPLSKQASMKLRALEYTLDCLARTLQLPAEDEVRGHLEVLGYQYHGTSKKNIERQWNHLLQWWRQVFLVPEKGQT
jgi:hypothetical protein